MTPIGFLGVGTIASAMVEGLRAAWPGLAIHLSPRSEVTSRALATAHPMVRREATNAAVVEASAIVVLSMLPTQLDAAVSGLPFRRDHVVVSCVAGAPSREVARLVAPARVCRCVPLPMIARREGPIVLHPALPEIVELIAPLGDLITLDRESVFSTFAAGSAVMSTFLALEASIADWMAGRGAAPEDASAYVRSLFRALAETARASGTVDASTLVTEHETPGGLNERVRRSLQAEGWFDAPGTAFDAIARLGRADLGTGRNS